MSDLTGTSQKTATPKGTQRSRIVFTVERPEPTPRPWELGVLRNCTDGFPDSLAVLPAGLVGRKKRGPAICLVAALSGVDLQDEANGKFIVRACNTHDDLLAAAKRALNVLKAQGESVRPGNALGALEAAINKAEGRTAK